MNASQINISIQDKAAELLNDAEVKAVRIGREKAGAFFVAVIRHARGRVFVGQKVYRFADVAKWLATDVTSFEKEQAKAVSAAEHKLTQAGCTLFGEWQSK